MRDYIILNGKMSSTIQGLIISSLPSITKPKIRTEIIEIDGKDGDEVTTLGYSAYDKEITIGLSYNYDVDEVIEYFNSSGIVTFSNEPDKYYRYKIIEQIDFEKLLRFKTAQVTMHVQPFKYSLDDNIKCFSASNLESVEIRNAGNIYSKPIITIKGSDNISVFLNNELVFVIALGNIGKITIDTENLEAYLGNTLLNRLVVGNYENFRLKVGKNVISFNGNVTEIEIENFSRWI